MTTQIKSFDKASANNVIHEAILALEEVAETYGLTFKRVGSASFSPYELCFKLSARTLDSEGNTIDPTHEMLKRRYWQYGLKKENIGQLFVWQGHHYRLVGCKPSNRKYPLIAVREYDGKRFKFEVEFIQHQVLFDPS